MAGGSSGEAEENYWPGYVDALTAMTKVLTFIMMILGIVIFAMSQNVSRSLIESIAAAARIEVPASGNLDELRGRLVEAIAASHARRDPSPPSAAPPAADGRRGASGLAPSLGRTGRDIASDSLPARPAAPVAAGVSLAGAVIAISFRRQGVELDEAASRELTGALQAGGFLGGARRLDIRASARPEGVAVSQARRLAFYRAMLVRDQLVRDGVSPSRISVRVEDDTGGDADHVRILAR